MAKRPTENERFISKGGDPINPHPDGEPWVKCCSHPLDNTVACQCFAKKPINGSSRLESYLSGLPAFGIVHPDFVKPIQQAFEAKERFFCIHRKDGNFHRECAGWAKLKEKTP